MLDSDNAPAEDDETPDEAGSNSGGDKSEADDEFEAESDVIDLEYVKIQVELLSRALAFVQEEVPSYSMRSDKPYEFDQSDVPASVKRAKERAIIAAFGRIAREFDSDLGGAL